MREHTASSTRHSTGHTTGQGAEAVQESPLEGLKPLLLDVAVPLGAYYLLHGALGVGTVAALALSSIVPAFRSVLSIVKRRTVNGLAGLILAVNMVSLALSTVTGDPRLMLAKDSGVSGIIALGILLSVVRGRPLMTAGVRPWVVKGDVRKAAAWERLAPTAGFRRAERIFSLVWGFALLGECVVRVIGAYSVPVDTMVWLGNVILAVAMTVAFVISGRFGAAPMETMVQEAVDAANAANEASAADATGMADGEPVAARRPVAAGEFAG
ncbi:VC0807 family protein [Streptomyces sp. NPDC050560]|uniref:VC0807 family protein n=1 Tax=Streptomyces sp. NPDC050560 TaxID=3365630 RepID=UPI0037B56360